MYKYPFLLPALVFLPLIIGEISRGHSSDVPSPVVEAHLKYLRVNGKPSFGAKWFPDKDQGSINVALLWSPYNVEVAAGFSLTHASERFVLAPPLPSGCVIEALKGSLNWREAGVSSIGIILKGPPCVDYFPRLAEKPLELVFKNVPYLIKEGHVEKLHLKVLELPGHGLRR